jgi:uncharacterized protein YbaR (Trm112 family)/SAM-dependent methyltransferase
MTPKLLDYLCDPITGEPLLLTNPRKDENGMIVDGQLRNSSGKNYPIINGIPRFINSGEIVRSVESFGDEWNFFNFTDFKVNWLTHTVKNTFGTVDAFKGKIILDAGGGSGAQTLWMLESGAEHVIMLELSHSVDDVVGKNLSTRSFLNYDVIQCSIDSPPLRSLSITGMVICHNVIQHTPSVEKTAYALYNLVAPGGQFVFNCYPLNDKGIIRWIRFHLIYMNLRKFLSKLPFALILFYARTMGILRLLPVIGITLEKLNFCVQGDVPKLKNESFFARLKRKFKATVLNTFDCFGSHEFQHHKSDDEILNLVKSLQPDSGKIRNLQEYFQRPQPIGCALRIYR